MADVFEEVEEELRAARYQTLVQRGWPYAVGAVALALLVTFGVWGFNKHQVDEQSKASITYDQALVQLQNGDATGADAKFASLAASAPAGYRAMALMQQAGIRIGKDKDEEAVRLLDAAAKAAPDAVLADNARLKAAYRLMDLHPGDLAEIETRLTPLMDDKRPYHLMARDALASARLQAGKPGLAQADLGVLTISPDVTQATQSRAQAARHLIDAGSASVLPAAAIAKPEAPPKPAASQLPDLSALANSGAAQ